MGLLIFIGIMWIIIDLIKEACEPTIPAENWKNSKLIHEDTFSNQISSKEFQKNLRNGKYK